MDQDVDYLINELIVPREVRYVSEWKEYSLNNYPFPHILNKVLTGCGFTEGCLENEQNLILLSPRKILLENKRDKHRDDINIYYAENIIDKIVNYEQDISKSAKSVSLEKPDTEEERLRKLEIVKNFKDKIRNHWEFCRSRRLPCKILVTYDSFRHVVEALEGDIKYFQTVVDEFQSIFIDARFKSEAELELVNHLQSIQKKYGVQRICFVSATPMLEKYLIQLDEFKDLPYYRFDWKTANPGRVRKPNINLRYTYRPLSESVNLVIEKYKNSKFEVRMIEEEDGTVRKVVSNEAVLFFNSVKGICQAIRTNKLDISECNILCADTLDNKKKVREAFNDVIKEKQRLGISVRGLCTDEEVIGRIPMEGEQHKMFTFCTRTVYLGSDFCSTCARTFIFSDSNVDCLSVDISLDLEQILGRQRLDNNPWKNMATLYVKTTASKRKMTKEYFQSIVNEKVSNSESILRSYNSAEDKDKGALVQFYQTAVKADHYRNNYVAVNEHAGSTLVPVFNKLVMLSELRAFEVQQEDYADRFTVFNTIEGRDIDLISDSVKNFVESFNKINQSVNKLKYLVQFLDDPNHTEKDQEDVFEFISPKYRDYVNNIGISRIKALSYIESDVKREMLCKHTNSLVGDKLIELIYNNFIPGNKYSNVFIKERLKSIYDSIHYTETAKASQLELYFILKKVKFLDHVTNKWVNGIEIIAKR